MAKNKILEVKFKERVASGYGKTEKKMPAITFRISPRDKELLIELANELDDASPSEKISLSSTFRALIRHGRKVEKSTLLAYIIPKT